MHSPILNIDMSDPKHWEVPAFEVAEFAPKRTKYCFIPIVYNEGPRFIRQLEQMSENAALADIIVAERRSTDGSTDPELLKNMAFAPADHG